MNNKLIGAFLVLIGVLMVPGAALELNDQLAHPNPKSVDFKTFTADLPTSGYFKLSGAQLEMNNALYVDDNGKVDNIYVPLQKAGAELDVDGKAPIAVLVRVADTRSRNFVEAMQKIDDKDETKMLKFLTANQKEFQVARPIQGTLAEGFDGLDDDDKRALERSESKLDSNFVILQEGVSPSIGGRVFGLLFGLAIFCCGGVMLFKKPG